MTNLGTKYMQLCQTESDINELLPYLKKYSNGLHVVTEMGVRHAISTYALLYGLEYTAGDKRYIGYDLAKTTDAQIAMHFGKEAGIECEFHVADVLEVEIEETDLLFLDTLHTATQLTRELSKHSRKVRKYIAMHDTATHWLIGQEQLAGRSNDLNCGRGLKYAIEPFLVNRPEWKVVERLEFNNGLMILERK